MKLVSLLSALGLFGSSLQAASTPSSESMNRGVSRSGGRIATDLFWVADARKMDEFLAKVPVAKWRNGAPTREVLPETTTAWRDYAVQACRLAAQGRDAEAAGRLAQMVKLAAVYRAHGGLQNMVQAEEIRYLAGRTAAELGSGVAARIQSPYMEKSPADCLGIIESWAGGEKGRVSAEFWQQLQDRAVLTHYRLAGTGRGKLSARP